MKNSPAVAKLSLDLAAMVRRHIDVPDPTATGGDLPSLVSAYWKVNGIIDAPEEGPRTRRHRLNQMQLIDLEHISLAIYRQVMALTGLSIHPAWRCVMSAIRIDELGGDFNSLAAKREVLDLVTWVAGCGFREQIILERWMVLEGATA
ncbi:hypothetical protein [Pseudomonas putida]|uniref:Uncharacterized protein n=1 Tax=Pseudomonas putida TaxID=303 RepID=A0A1B2F136_PSEPU|nr:hypothetical protein [Pseudomonas putida]ANY85960.1 hypothetical protein IEC33019_0356 [Pseudomonas putida]